MNIEDQKKGPSFRKLPHMSGHDARGHDEGGWSPKPPREFGLRVQGLGFRVEGLGFRVLGLGFRVWGALGGIGGLGRLLWGRGRCLEGFQGFRGLGALRGLRV